MFGFARDSNYPIRVLTRAFATAAFNPALYLVVWLSDRLALYFQPSISFVDPVKFLTPKWETVQP